MRKKNYKGRCTKMKIGKAGICRLYDDLQTAFVKVLEQRDDIASIQVNVPIENTEYTTDFVCKKKDGDLMVRECVYRRLLLKPLTARNLDISREYWKKRGVDDYGIVVEKE